MVEVYLICIDNSISKYTMYYTKDLNERLSLMPIEKKGKYYSLEGYALGKLGFNDIKNFATLSGIKSLYPDLTNEFITDILNSKLNNAYLIKNQGFEDISNRKQDFEDLSGAILRNSPVNFIYYKKQRKVNPYKLINNNGIWYLLADENDKLKTFTFSKITKFRWEDENKKFSPKKDFLKELEQNKSNWYTDKIEVILQVDNEAKEYFNRKEIFPNQKILDKNDEYLTISTKVSYDDEVLKVVKYWIPYIKIVEPVYLKEKLAKLLKTYIS
ncbi:transcriptional regulator [Halarcobacter mediterraneus]|uniref:Transcriptional regulator n=1 Tax=Halarcobacter mediterraneus TaxID=2023153 RepID=A0A4Q1AYC3_9BACT|nr:WYL domain-containing protein [Halarcobacter mediterraneus]RXK14040.1 transcriptional regulator [Halarcobacter mediterraneus]